MNKTSNTSKFMENNKLSRLILWHNVKSSLINKKPPVFNEGEIWWLYIGENVGNEINGKGDKFTRPVLVLRKLSPSMFFGIPLTTKQKHGAWFVTFRFQNHPSCASLPNGSSFSALRLKDYIGNINRLDLVRIRMAYHELIFGY